MERPSPYRTLCRSGLVALLLLTNACSSSVYRLKGTYPTEVGEPKTDCERDDWLIVANTRAEIIPEGRKVSVPNDDGVGLYRTGGDESPESIVGLKDELSKHGHQDVLDSKAEKLAPHDQDRIVSASLGLAGLAALAVGGLVFRAAFSEENKGTSAQEQKIDGSKAIVGSIFVGLGIGLSAAGIVINPTHEERTRADAVRYVFMPDELDREGVEDMVDGYNRDVRKECKAAGE